MYKINEILTPIKFMVLMLQIILTISIAFTKVRNCKIGRKYKNDVAFKYKYNINRI